MNVELVVVAKRKTMTILSNDRSEASAQRGECFESATVQAAENVQPRLHRRQVSTKSGSVIRHLSRNKIAKAVCYGPVERGLGQLFRCINCLVPPYMGTV